MSELDYLVATIEMMKQNYDWQVKLPEGWNSKEVHLALDFEDGKLKFCEAY